MSLDENNDNLDITEGRLYLVFMNTKGTVARTVKISDVLAGFNSSMLSGDGFESSITNMGDLNGDGVQDLAVGAHADENDDNSDGAEGAVYILFMNTNGTVASNIKISDNLSGFNPEGLGINDRFGSSVANIGDVDGDGVQDLAVGAYFDENDDNSDKNEGAIYILFMNTSVGVKSKVKI